MSPRIRCSLKKSSDNHYDHAGEDGFLAANLLAEEGGGYGAEEASYFVDRYDEAGYGGGGGVEGVCEGCRVDQSGGSVSWVS